MDYKIIIYIIFGVLPSLAWLSYYLRKDVHPESNGTILKIFLWGMFVTVPVFFVQIGLAALLNKLNIPQTFSDILYWFIIISLTEEFFIYLVIKLKILNSPDFDEPLDVMLYMVIAALGFAALENVLYLVGPVGPLSFAEIINRTMIISFVRFIGATFLHTLASGILGYFIAVSISKAKTRFAFLALGFFVAMVLHGLYDFSIMTFEGPLKIAVPIIVLIVLAFFVMAGFEKLKKLKGVCEIKTN